jgi:hypothetical protein
MQCTASDAVIFIQGGKNVIRDADGSAQRARLKICKDTTPWHALRSGDDDA